MRPFAVVATLLSVLAILASPQLFAQDWQTGVAKVSVKPSLEKNPGTAVVVAIKGDTAFLVTCFHVIEGDSSPRVEFVAAPSKALTATRKDYQKGSGDRGLALLQVEGVPKSIHPIPLGTSGSVGDAVIVAGFPAPDQVFTVVNANIASKMGLDISVSYDTAEGFSGGPVIQAGSAVALVWGHESGFGRAMPASIVKEYVEALNVQLGDGSSSPEVAHERVPKDNLVPHQTPKRRLPIVGDALKRRVELLDEIFDKYTSIAHALEPQKAYFEKNHSPKREILRSMQPSIDAAAQLRNIATSRESDLGRLSSTVALVQLQIQTCFDRMITDYASDIPKGTSPSLSEALSELGRGLDQLYAARSIYSKVMNAGIDALSDDEYNFFLWETGLGDDTTDHAGKH